MDLNKNSSPESNAASAIKVGQLIYTSFEEVGFQLLVTSGTPLEIQHSLIDKIVGSTWNPHNPPGIGYRAAYLYQLASKLEHTVFGWLYFDGNDDYGRSGVPYLVAYYFLGKLDEAKIQLILSCIEKGPINQELLNARNNHKPEDDLATLTLSLCHDQKYDASRPGVILPDELWQDSQDAVKANRLIDWFFPHSDVVQLSQKHSDSHHSPSNERIWNQNRKNQANLGEDKEIRSSAGKMDTTRIEGILEELVEKTMGIQGATLLSAEGQPIVPAIGLDDNTSGIIAGTILYMAKGVQSELNWQNTEMVTLRGPGSYVILNFCQAGIYLLTKSAKVPMGLIEGAINRAIMNLNAEFKGFDGDQVPRHSDMPPLNLPAAEKSTETERSSIIDISVDGSDTSAHTINYSTSTLKIEETQVNDGADINGENSNGADINGENSNTAEVNLDQYITYRGRPTTS